MTELTTDELKIICDTVVRLTEIGQKECPHLSVDNFAKGCMDNLLASLMAHKEGRMVIPLDEAIPELNVGYWYNFYVYSRSGKQRKGRYFEEVYDSTLTLRRFMEHEGERYNIDECSDISPIN